MNANTPLLLSWAHYPVTVLGFGRRVGVWFQGCSIQCKGCVSQDTWSFDQDKTTTVADVMRWVRSLGDEPINGLTISGGEPFDQPDAVVALVESFRNLFNELEQQDGSSRDILCYSGYPFHRIEAVHSKILKQLDALISEPFVERTSTIPLAGSSNQRIHSLSPLGQQRYSSIALSAETNSVLQVEIDSSHRMWAIGIPRRGDLDRMQKGLGELGLHIDEVSWR